ncbi:MAG: hypothetical protein AB1488_05505 [Nitrospirota bacterium]
MKPLKCEPRTTPLQVWLQGYYPSGSMTIPPRVYTRAPTPKVFGAGRGFLVVRGEIDN